MTFDPTTGAYPDPYDLDPTYDVLTDDCPVHGYRHTAGCPAARVIHGFRSASSVTAYCGIVERPDPDRPRVDGYDGTVPVGACPQCAAVYETVRRVPVPDPASLRD
jgi:hypothetical protein